MKCVYICGFALWCVCYSRKQWKSEVMAERTEAYENKLLPGNVLSRLRSWGLFLDIFGEKLSITLIKFDKFSLLIYAKQFILCSCCKRTWKTEIVSEKTKVHLQFLWLLWITAWLLDFFNTNTVYLRSFIGHIPFYSECFTIIAEFIKFTSKQVQWTRISGHYGVTKST